MELQASTNSFGRVRCDVCRRCCSLGFYGFFLFCLGNDRISVDFLGCLFLFLEAYKPMRLKPSQFHPPPKVDSQVICLTFRECPLTPKVDSSWLLTTVKAAFSHRRKILRNSLLASNLSNLTVESVSTALEESSIEPQRRPESLTLEEFLRLAKALEGEGAAETG